MKIFILVLLSIVVTKCYSQDILTLYQKDFPNEYYTTKENNEFLFLNLQKAVQTRPDMVYYLSEILNSFSVTHDTVFFLKDMRYFASISNDIGNKKIMWGRDQIKKTSSLDSESSLKQKVIDFFSPAARDSIKTVSLSECPFSIDINKKYYFSFKFYTNDPSLEYNASENYEEKSIFLEKQIIQHFKNLADFKGVDENLILKDRSINGIMDYWYLFATEDLPDRNNMEAYNIVSDYTNNNYSIEDNFSRFMISGGYGINNTAKVSYTINEDPFHEPIDHSNLTPSDQYSIDITYRYKIKPVRSIFSYFNINFSVQSFKLPDNINQYINNTIRYRIITPFDTTDYKEDITSNGAIIKVDKMTTLIFEPSVPIYFPYRNIFLEFGCYIGMNIIKYTLDYGYHYKRTETKTNGNGTSTTTVTLEGDSLPILENKTQTNWIVRPVANILFEPVSHIFLKATIAPDLSKVSLGISF